MNVGISSSFNSEGGGGADRRAGCSAGLTYPAGGTGVGRMPRSRNGSTPGAAREAVSAPAAGLSNPVAITVTRISPCMAGSFTVPKMISASSPAASFTTSEIWVTSPSVRSSPPVMLMRTPVAPVIEMLSSSGDEIACCTASIARFSPRPMPVPMIAAPPFCITVRTSAKSTFTMPVTVMREEIPCVAWSTTSSAFLLSRACASVFTEMNSTPWSPSSTMRFRALPPPPPTPTTFIRAFCDTVSSSSKIMAPSGDRSEEVLQPPLQRSKPPLDARTLPRRATGHAAPPLREAPRRVQHQAHRHRVSRRLHAVDEPRDPLLRRPGPPPHRERLARQLHHPRQVRRPAREHHPGPQASPPVPRPLTRPLHTAAQILRGRGLHRHEVHLHLEPRAGHPHGVRDPALLVDHVLLWDIVQQLVIAPQRHRARHFVHARHVLRGDLVARHRHHSRRRPRRDVLPRDAARHRADLDARHALGVAHRRDDRPARLVDVAHHAAPHARVLREPHAQHFGERQPRQLAHHLRDHGARLGAAEIEPGDDLAVPAHAPPPPPPPPPPAVAFRRTTTWPAKRAARSP